MPAETRAGTATSRKEIDFGRPNISSAAVSLGCCRLGVAQTWPPPRFRVRISKLEPLRINLSGATMSLQVNLSDREINSKYQEIVNATSSTDWVIYTYDKGTNDLKVQASGDGGLDEMVDEFMDSR